MQNRFVIVWDLDGDSVRAAEHEEPRVDAAVSQYLESGGTKDEIVDLDLVTGGIYHIRASYIRSWMLSTPEFRYESYKHETDMEKESKEAKERLGIPSWSHEE